MLVIKLSNKFVHSTLTLPTTLKLYVQGGMSKISVLTAFGHSSVKLSTEDKKKKPSLASANYKSFRRMVIKLKGHHQVEIFLYLVKYLTRNLFSNIKLLLDHRVENIK